MASYMTVTSALREAETGASLGLAGCQHSFEFREKTLSQGYKLDRDGGGHPMSSGLHVGMRTCAYTTHTHTHTCHMHT